MPTMPHIAGSPKLETCSGAACTEDDDSPGFPDGGGKGRPAAASARS